MARKGKAWRMERAGFGRELTKEEREARAKRIDEFIRSGAAERMRERFEAAEEEIRKKADGAK